MDGEWLLQVILVSNRFTLVELDEMLLEGELHHGNMFLHFEFKGEKFTKSLYVDFLEIWDITINSLKERGINEVFSFIPKDNKIAKWQEMFGLTLLIEFEDNYLYRRIL